MSNVTTFIRLMSDKGRARPKIWASNLISGGFYKGFYRGFAGAAAVLEGARYLFHACSNVS